MQKRKEMSAESVEKRVFREEENGEPNLRIKIGKDEMV
jgi:hypothetical protein